MAPRGEYTTILAAGHEMDLRGHPKTSGSRGIHAEPQDLRMDTVPDRVAKLGDPCADIDEHAGYLDGLLELELARRDEGLGDAPWPPSFARQPGEAKRVQPSRARKDA